ncbi:MAG: argininosuccinate lyase [Chloroflexota bacterium]
MTLWGGRFIGKLDAAAWALNTSLPVDQRMSIQDIDGSIAWAEAIFKAGILDVNEHRSIENGLMEIKNEFLNKLFVFSDEDEDIHSAVERRLFEIIGVPAKKLHTGRSRNDQVATDFRLWMLDAIQQLSEELLILQSTLVDRAIKSDKIIMPGYTHLQRAQPILLSHWWLSHFWPLQRDRERLVDLIKRTAILPLGSGALAGTTVPVNRLELAVKLGFDSASPNSLDSVSDRDFATEFLFCCALIGTHISKLSEQIVLFTSSEFGFFELTDNFSTGSSLMPQKKNPDIFELSRGKAGTILGLLTGLLATLKGLPSTYDKDLQEDKAAVFSGFDILNNILPVLNSALISIIAKPEKMRTSIDSFMMSTDFADYLVAKGIPFRETHSIAGKAVKMAIDLGIGMDELSIRQLKNLCPVIEADVYNVFDPMESIKRRNSSGGTSPESVLEQINLAKLKINGE